MHSNKQTFVLCGTRRSDLAEAEFLIPTIRKYQANAEIIVFTNFTDYTNPAIDHIHIIEKPFFGFADKLYAMIHTDRERFLYMDCDTFLLDGIDEVFHLLDRFDIAAAHAPNRWTYKLDHVPDTYPEFNTGIILMKKNERVRVFLQKWFDLYLHQLEQGLQIPSGDQPAFRECLYFSDLRIATLTPEYNCRFNMGAFVSHTVKILHGRISDFDYVQKHINIGPSFPWNDQPGIRFIKYNDPLDDQPVPTAFPNTSEAPSNPLLKKIGRLLSRS